MAPTAPVSVKQVAPVSLTPQLGRGDRAKINIYDSFKAEKKVIDKKHIGLNFLKINLSFERIKSYSL